jgi:hypothetical protein
LEESDPWQKKKLSKHQKRKLPFTGRKKDTIIRRHGVHRPGKHDGQGHLRPVQPGKFPQLFQGIRRPADWYEYWDEILDTSDAPCFKWFKGGKINASYNCVDRHLKDNKNKTAIHFVPNRWKKIRAHHLPGTLCARERIRRPAQGFCRI